MALDQELELLAKQYTDIFEAEATTLLRVPLSEGFAYVPFDTRKARGLSTPESHAPCYLERFGVHPSGLIVPRLLEPKLENPLLPYTASKGVELYREGNEAA